MHYFLTFLPQFVDPEIGSMQIQSALFGCIFIASTFTVMGCAGLAGGQARRLLDNSKVGIHLVHKIVVIILIRLGLWRGFKDKN